MTTVTDEEIDRLLEALKMAWGVDLTEYSRASLTRRIQRVLEREATGSFQSLQNRITTQRPCFDRFLQEMLVNVTEFFRDPEFFRSMMVEVLPILSAKRTISIWHAGCASGEEVFSLAILLREAGLLERCDITGTDLNDEMLKVASAGGSLPKDLTEVERAYLKSGGTGQLKDHLSQHFGQWKLDPSLMEVIRFRKHDLVREENFDRFDLILCRNTLIYFQKPLQSRVIRLFTRSLHPQGFLALGSKESLLFSPDRHRYSEVDAKQKIYRLI